MTIPGGRILNTTGKQLRGITALVLSLVFAGDSLAALRHQYNFNSGDGTTAIDSVAGGVNGTLIAGTIDTADHRYVLDGTSRYVDIPGANLAINTYTNLTIESWLLVDPSDNNRYTASIGLGDTDGSGAGQQYILMQPTRGGTDGSSGQITAASAGGEARRNTQIDLGDNHLHQTVLTISGTELDYYVDGVQVGTPLTLPAGTDLAHVSNNHAYLGKSVWSGDPLLTGALYKVSIYDDFKSPTDVATLYNGGNGCGSCGNLGVTINRDTGAVTLKNTLSVKKLVGYQINSTNGAINTATWHSISDFGDQDSGGSVDPNNTWSVVSTTKQALSETENPGGPNPGATFANQGSISLGNLWVKSPFEDYTATITYLDQSFNLVTVSTQIDYSGHGGVAYSRSDFNLDGVIDGADYAILKQHHLQTLAGTLPIDTFALGDINGDLKDDYSDFRLFKADYTAAHGAAGFASMIAAEGGFVPEPASYSLLLLGAAVILLSRQRKSALGSLQKCVLLTDNIFSARPRTMMQPSKLLLLISLLLMTPGISHAQVIFSENFDSYPAGAFAPANSSVNNFSGAGQIANQAATIAQPGQGGAGGALAFDYDVLITGSGALNTNFQTPFPAAQPTQTDTNVADYQLDFDFRIAAGANTGYYQLVVELFNTTTGNFKQAILNPSNVTPGGAYVHETFNLNDMGTPFGGAFDATVPTWGYRLVALGFPPGAALMGHQTLQLDNVSVTHLAAPLVLLVDPATGKARIKNTSTSAFAFDYYHLDSDNASLLTANFNGTTGWNSLHDQGKDSLGPGVGQSWDEVDTNSSSRLVEQFLGGTTTLGAGQSVSIGAPINPALLNGQLSTLHFHVGGPAYAAEAFAAVQFQTFASLIGDYNDNGVVDAADYVIARAHLGQSFSLANRDPANTGVISTADITSWKSHFGAVSGAGSGSGAGLIGTVPEPSTGTLCIIAACLFGTRKMKELIRGKSKFAVD